MASTRIRLEQIGKIYLEQQRSIFVPDNVRLGHIVPNFEQEPTPENWENGYDLIGTIGKETIGMVGSQWQKEETILNYNTSKFKVLNLDDSEIGFANTKEEAIQLFLEFHPHFDKESIKTFIYDN